MSFASAVPEAGAAGVLIYFTRDLTAQPDIIFLDRFSSAENSAQSEEKFRYSSLHTLRVEQINRPLHRRLERFMIPCATLREERSARVAKNRMGVSYYKIQNLESPLKYIEEVTTLIPREGSLTLENKGFKIFILLNGSISIEAPPSPILSLTDHDILILPKPCSQIYRSGCDPHFHGVVLMFDRRKMSELAKSSKLTLMARAAQMCQMTFPTPAKIAGEASQPFQYLVSQILEEARNPLLQNEIKLNALICALLVDLAKTSTEAGHPALPTKLRGHKLLLQHADEFMFKNLSSSLTAGQIAWQLRVSQEHLTRVFKKETGQPLMRYLSALRIDKAKNLLLSSNLTITQVTEACGFSSRALFYRTFGQHCKMTPAQYRTASHPGASSHGPISKARSPRR